MTSQISEIKSCSFDRTEPSEEASEQTTDVKIQAILKSKDQDLSFKDSTSAKQSFTLHAQNASPQTLPLKVAKEKKDLSQEDLLKANTWVDGYTVLDYLERFAIKSYLEAKKPFSIVKSLAVRDFRSIFSKTIVNARGTPEKMKATPPKEGRLVCSLNINENHYAGLFIDFERRNVFYYDPFGQKSSFPYKKAEIIDTFFKGHKKSVSFHFFEGTNHQNDQVNCSRYTLKFCETLISANDPVLAYQTYISEDIDSDKIYQYVQELTKKYPLSKKAKLPETPGNIPSDTPPIVIEL